MAIHVEPLAQRHCGACEGGAAPLREEALDAMLRQTPAWELIDGKRIAREFKFENFRQTLTFVNRVGELAEMEDHHPHIHLSYNRCRIELWTHAVNGLSENDFILAAKIDELL